MIRVNRINRTEVLINPDQIEHMEETPDLVITLISGRKIVVSQNAEQVIDSIIKYKQSICRPPA